MEQVTEISSCKDYEYHLWTAAFQGNYIHLALEIALNPSQINMQHKGLSPLVIACQYDHPKCAKLLLDAGASLKTRPSPYEVTNNPELITMLHHYRKQSRQQWQSLRLCKFFQRGYCRNGNLCEYVHDQPRVDGNEIK